ncbi:MAG TPA: Mrp/NBP35 family ATP-binding protein [Candidatus Omnitrophota bacterium]|nr:Mrp/NBP35 family ATP-binding protein [Candidatus Omnitrophota bacterium]HRY85195.1 Mrp/NBP35 family ATP-binding protein [Candidatus Omnitrophota bacterium]
MTTFNKITREKVLDCLKQIREPLVGEDIVSLGLVREIEVDKNRVFLHLESSVEDPRLRDQFRETIIQSVLAIGASGCDVHFSEKPKCGVNPSAIQPIPGVKHVVAVASGKGGVGKSTVAVNLALALKKLGARVGLMDADIYGPNIPIMLGIPADKKPETAGQSEKIAPIDAHGIRAISIGFFADPEQPVIWRGPLLHKTIEQFLHRVEWGELDFLVVDLPPGTGDVQLSLSQWVHLSGAVVVTTPQEVALGDVRKAVNMFRQLEVTVLGVIENMTGPVFGKGGGEKMAEVFQVPFLGDIPLEAQIRECGDSGLPVVMGYPKSTISERFMKIAEAIRRALK